MAADLAKTKKKNAHQHVNLSLKSIKSNFLNFRVFNLNNFKLHDVLMVFKIGMVKELVKRLIVGFLV